MSPTQRLFREIRKRTTQLDSMDALEMFAGDGSRHTLDYRQRVGSLEAWEFEKSYEKDLRKNLPNARVLITDSFRELEKTPSAYHLVVIDCPGGLYGPDQKYCSHFEIFAPPLFRILRDSSIVILNVSPDADALLPNRTGQHSAALDEILRRRRDFYQKQQPKLIPVGEMVETYQRVALNAGFTLQWHQSCRRTTRSNAHYLALGLTRN